MKKLIGIIFVLALLLIFCFVSFDSDAETKENNVSFNRGNEQGY
ncbi:MAG: hypothetical protein ACK50A_10510 [Sphingobacteriaceae bacterium]|jgi:hypothetical protein